MPAPGEGAHPPINFHAFAACAFGAFHRDARPAIAENTPVLLLLRSDFRASERALADLKKQGRTVVVSLKETGLHQIAQQLCEPGKLSRFMKIVGEANGCIATTPQAAEIYQGVRSKRDPATVAFVPTPYPIEDERWNFSVARSQAIRNFHRYTRMGRAIAESFGGAFGRAALVRSDRRTGYSR